MVAHCKIENKNNQKLSSKGFLQIRFEFCSGIGVLLPWAVGSNLKNVPVVPHKAVAEDSKIGNYRRGELL